MEKIKKIQKTKRRILRKSNQVHRAVLQAIQKSDSIENPVFILGCGRSGTTILGKVLSHHCQITYLNEPRRIWVNNPCTDIWSSEAILRQGKLRLDEQDFEPITARKTKLDFAVELKLTQKPQLVEKLPANSFRIPYIYSLFPDARFIHMIRNGMEVSRSIAALYAKTGRWFGVNNYKWTLLSDYATSRNQEDLVEICGDNSQLKGLLEWSLSLSTIMEDLKTIPSTSILEVRYEELLKDPEDVCQRLESFIGLPCDYSMHQFASTKISRRSPKVENKEITPEEFKIGGDLLKKLGYI